MKFIKIQFLPHRKHSLPPLQTPTGQCRLGQCFSTARPRPGTGPWHQLYWTARGLRKLQYATRFNYSS